MGKLGIGLLVLSIIGLFGTATPARAGQSSASVQLATEIRPRTAVEADRPFVTLIPGERVTVQVTLKARVAAGEAIALALESAVPAAAFAGSGKALVSYEVGSLSGRLAGPAVLGSVRGSGVHQMAVTFALASQARGAVTLPLRFQAVVGGSPVNVAAATQAQP